MHGYIDTIKSYLNFLRYFEIPSDPLAIGLYIVLKLFVLCFIALIVIRISKRDKTQIVILLLLGLTIMGLGLRLWEAANTYRLHVTPAKLIGDELRYDDLGWSITQGKFFEWPGSTPIYPLFLALCYLIFGHSYSAVIYVQAFIGAGTIPLTYFLARRFTDRRYSLLSAMLIAVHPSLIFQVGHIYTEVLYTNLFMLTLISLLWALEKPIIKRCFASGLILGVTTLCRPATALIPFILTILMPHTWSLKRRAALLVVFTLTMIAVITPWAYHNYRAYHVFMPFSLSQTMFWHGTPEFYHIMKRKPNAITNVWNEELNPSVNGGHNPLTIEGDTYFNERAIASILAEPGIFLWYSLQKLLYFWIGNPAADWDWPLNLKKLKNYYSITQIINIFGARLLTLVGALVGLIILRHRIRDFLPLLIICFYFMIIYAGLIPVARYSEPLYPILAIIISCAVREISIAASNLKIKIDKSRI